MNTKAVIQGQIETFWFDLVFRCLHQEYARIVNQRRNDVVRGCTAIQCFFWAKKKNTYGRHMVVSHASYSALLAFTKLAFCFYLLLNDIKYWLTSELYMHLFAVVHRHPTSSRRSRNLPQIKSSSIPCANHIPEKGYFVCKWTHHWPFGAKFRLRK